MANIITRFTDGDHNWLPTEQKNLWSISATVAMVTDHSAKKQTNVAKVHGYGCLNNPSVTK